MDYDVIEMWALCATSWVTDILTPDRSTISSLAPLQLANAIEHLEAIEAAL